MTRLVTLLLIIVAPIAMASPNESNAGKYAEVDGLKMYYEIHGGGKPLVLLHGAFGTAESWANVLPTLTKTRQVIIIEQQGHGHTGDRDTPLSYEQMAEDTAALLKKSISKAQMFSATAMAALSDFGSRLSIPNWLASSQF